MAVIHVSSDGDDANSGASATAALQHVMAGVAKLHAGDTLLLHEGLYAEQVTLEDLVRVEIRSADGEHAVIDGAIEDFRTNPAGQWRDGDLDGEYVSLVPWPANTNRGAFVDTDQYVRLLTYDSLADLQADNELFGPLEEGEGPRGVSVEAEDSLTKRPFVYMGPGLFQDDKRFVHVRLRHTSLTGPGVTRYLGPEDATSTPLAIWTAPTPAVRIRRCPSLRMNHLTVRFGGGPSIRVEDSDHVWFDHLRILAGPHGLAIGEDCEGTTISNCSVDGGLPPWSFRSDRKDGYTTLDGDRNNLAEQTTKTLLSCVSSSSRTTVEQCEFAHGHDLQLNGPQTVFRANWIHDINDDAIFVGEKAIDLRIIGNVFEHVLTVLSTASKATAGPVTLLRNLVDLRRPTRHKRPLPNPAHVVADERPSHRFGNFFKSSFEDPDLNVVHNTVVINQSTRAVHNLFRAYDGQSRRQVLNNIFVGIDNASAVDRPLAYLPAAGDNALADGNSYHGIRRTPRILLQVRDGGSITALAAAADGVEEHGLDVDPRLRRFWGPLSFPVVEDLRLAPGSLAAVPGGVPLSDAFLRALDGNPPLGLRPTIGCYRFGAPPMAVGVDGLRPFPSSPLTGPQGPPA